EQSTLSVLADQLAWWDKPETLVQRFREAGLRDTRLSQLYISLVHQLLGFPRHLSQHVGGCVITRDPLHPLLPVENAAMAERRMHLNPSPCRQLLGCREPCYDRYARRREPCACIHSSGRRRRGSRQDTRLLTRRSARATASVFSRSSLPRT